MNIEKLETNKLKLTFEVDAQTFGKGLQYSYNKNKGSFNISGFRKGKAPRKIIENMYGKEIFYEDAINHVLQDAYSEALQEHGIKTVSKPEINVESISSEEGIVFTAEVYVKPEVTIGDYKGITYKAYDSNPTEEEIDKEIQKNREKNSRIITISDRAIEMGDIVTIDYEGFIGGQPFEGGKSEDYELVIGSGSFVDTFEQQLLGKNVGDEVQINVTFPKDYHSEELSGKPAMFLVKVNEIKHKELPELNDEFAQDVSEFDTLEEYRNDIKEKLAKLKSADADRDKEGQIMETLLEDTTMEVPDIMIENQIDQMLAQFGARLKSQGLSLDMYLQYTGLTEKQFRDNYRENAETQVKGRLALEAIAEKEDFEVTEEDINTELEVMAGNYGVDVDTLKGVLRPEDIIMIKEDILVEKALSLVMEKAVELV